jgi:hypothetical protein
MCVQTFGLRMFDRVDGCRNVERIALAGDALLPVLAGRLMLQLLFGYCQVM